MSAGSYPAGTGPAGYAPIADVGALPDQTPPVAVYWDANTLDYELGSNGQLTQTHPVDQKMAIGLCVPRGRLRSAPTVGSTFHEIEFLDSPSMQREVEDRARSAVPVADMLAAGEVSIPQVDYSTITGRLVVRVRYRNLVLERELSSAPATITSRTVSVKV